MTTKQIKKLVTELYHFVEELYAYLIGDISAEIIKKLNGH